MTTWLVTPAQLYSPLDAVNLLISTLGEAPISTITPPPTSDAVEALSRLNEADLEVQSRGWHWNREDNYQLALDGSGHLPLPDQTLRAVASANQAGTYDVVDRGGQLYDRTNHTFVFTTAIQVDLIAHLSWDLIPQVARNYITYLAAQRFQARKQGAEVVLQVNAADVARALTLLEQYEDEITAGQNSIQGNQGVLNRLYGYRGMRRSRPGQS